MTKTNDIETPAKIDIYQLSFATWGEPLLVIASSFAEAVRLASSASDRFRRAGPVMMWNATEEWLSASPSMAEHTSAALKDGCMGVAVYDTEGGWVVEDLERHE